jgi:nucleotide-binding universal stress UspA family protein
LPKNKRQLLSFAKEGELMFKKILVPLDGSELAAKVLPQVEDLAKTYQSQVTLITLGYFASAAGTLEATPKVIREAADQEK